MKKVFCILLAIVIGIGGYVPWVYSIVKGIQFDANCGDYLKLAADANSIDIAEKHLSTAIKYLEENDMTSGYTKIINYYPKNDFGLWYENLKTAQTQLQETQSREYTELEESNVLMKLRETLLDGDGYLTHPEGVSMKHNYTLMFWLNMLLWLPCLVAVIILIWLAMDDF